MGKTVGRFDYDLITDETVLITPLVKIVLKGLSRNGDGMIAVTPQLTELEIDANVELLKADLDAVAKRAKSAIRRAKEKQERG